MSYAYLYLRFETEAAAEMALASWLPDAPRAGVNISTVGTIYKPTGETMLDGEGAEIPVMSAVEGWHVNVALAPWADDGIAAMLAPHAVTPAHATPARLWAGQAPDAAAD